MAMMQYAMKKLKEWLRKMKRSLTIVVGKEAAQTPSRLRVRSSTPDATTYEWRNYKQVSKKG
jgi:hypothetical protein